MYDRMNIQQLSKSRQTTRQYIHQTQSLRNRQNCSRAIEQSKKKANSSYPLFLSFASKPRQLNYKFQNQEYQQIEIEIFMKMCQQSRSQSIQQVLSITLALVLSFLFCCSICFILKHHRCRKFRLLFNPHFQNLNTKFGTGTSGVIGGLQFIQHLRNFVNIINQSVDYQSFITIEDGSEKYQKAIVTAQQVNSKCYHIQLKGEDNEGDWSASGAIVSTNQGVICWFLKQYDEDLRRGSRDSSGQYIYISDPSNLEGISGRWQGVEKKKQRKGEWRIKKQVKSQLKQSESHMQILN